MSEGIPMAIYLAGWLVTAWFVAPWLDDKRRADTSTSAFAIALTLCLLLWPLVVFGWAIWLIAKLMKGISR